MITEFHFIRPFWLSLCIPLGLLSWRLFKQHPVMHAWRAVCDEHLLPFLIQTHGASQRAMPLLFIFLSLLFIIISLAGPTWSRLPVPVYEAVQPRVIVLDMSKTMLAHDLSPNRLDRAKFKIHDLMQRHDLGQIGLVVYTDEPFVVSPLTDDGQTIDALLSSLTHAIMPIDGNRLDRALNEASQLIKQAGFSAGQILVLTSEPPSETSIDAAQTLAKQGIETSIIPIRADSSSNALFEPIATHGSGKVIAFTDTADDLNQWLNYSKSHHYRINQNNEVERWRDEGRLFLIPALLFLLPVFRRGWLQRIKS
jgi:Ca-activated chloride channel homolog